MRAARSLPMPGMARSPCSSSVATACGHVAIVSAADRYARTLNALSSLISSRSAISPSTRETCWLSTRESVALEREVEDACAAGLQRAADGVAGVGRAVAEETAAASGAAHLGRRCPFCHGARDEIVDGWRGHSRSETLAVVPFFGDRASDLVPVAAFERAAHGDGRVADPLEAVEHVAVAVDVPLGD